MECLMRLRTITVALVLALAAGAAAGARADAAEPTVSCDRIVLRDRSGSEDGFRILLDTLSVPGARHLASDTTAAQSGPWRWYRNAGIAIRAGASGVSVTVPEGWRDRVALSWGGSRPSSTIRFSACAAADSGPWSSFSGGIHLARRTDCVPLQVTVGGMSTTVRVGVGRACGRI
jgi:hypothetical protein